MKTTDIKTYFFGLFIKLSAIVVLIITTTSVYHLNKEYRSFVDYQNSKIKRSLSMIQYDLLNQIVSQNYDSMYEQLKHFAGEIDADTITLISADKVVEVKAEGENQLNIVQQAISDGFKRVSDHTIKYELKNFAGTKYGDVRIETHNSTVKKFLFPLLNQFALSLFMFLLAVICVCYFFYRKLVNNIVVPVNDLSIQLQSVDHNSLEIDPRRSDSTLYEIKKLELALSQYQQIKKQLNDFETNQKMSLLAMQVAHDVRSPLAALAAATQDMSQLPEDKRILIRSAVQRIGDIANDLAGRGNQKGEGEGSHSAEAQTQLLSGIIDSLISEKRLQFRARLGVNIQSTLDTDSYGLFAEVAPAQFKRVLSNLVNNAVEAIEDCGTVTIGMKKNNGKKLAISVSDSGSGIPPEIFSKLMQQGATFNKKEGQGLGLFHARETVESWGGTIEITSKLGEGTIVTIVLPFQHAPSWFVPELVVYPGTNIVIFDDDDSIHQIWKGRFETKESGVMLHHFSNGVALGDWYSRANINGALLILCDYEILGSEETGLDVIKSLGLGDHTVLVTSRFEEELVRKNCEELGVKLLPKNLAGFVPIRQIKIPTDLEFVLIDDNRISRRAWEIMARAKNKKILTFERPKDFYDVAERINKDAKLYVDLNLGAGVNGKDVSREISTKGFDKIFLYTGEDHVDTKDMPWIKGVVGKDLPFGKEKD